MSCYQFKDLTVATMITRVSYDLFSFFFYIFHHQADCNFFSKCDCQYRPKFQVRADVKGQCRYTCEIKWLELSSGGNMEHILPSGIDRVFLLHARLAKVAKRFESSQVDISSQV
ncbi:PREDICTED: uncharacterized protein LOC105565192 isoform X1 [Vollenhovia emeryi]|uniref:uncharacterized protein LOC105565192 isoform X1 n=1 Tax=Vollenhovia emeryi TaxID=411798 RepID=UPI0005F3A400|nr:PREDICTED: uncharacterized protein LOC105565192 isoform X1 [Vollenhovia emeryi]